MVRCDGRITQIEMYLGVVHSEAGSGVYSVDSPALHKCTKCIVLIQETKKPVVQWYFNIAQRLLFLA